MPDENQPRPPVAPLREPKAHVTEQLTLWNLREHLGVKVAHELDLIGQRMTWLVTSQSFLFAAWVASGAKDRPPTMPFVIAIIGWSVAIVAYFAIGAAMRVLDRLGGHYLEAVELALQAPPMGHRREDGWTIKVGNLPALVLPPVFAGIWTGAGFRAWKRIPSFSADDFWAGGAAVAVTLVGCAVSYFFLWRPRRGGTSTQPLGEPLKTLLEQADRWPWESPARPSPTSLSNRPSTPASHTRS